MNKQGGSGGQQHWGSPRGESLASNQAVDFGNPDSVPRTVPLKPAVHGLPAGGLRVCVPPRRRPTARSWGPIREPRKEAAEEAHLSSLALLRTPVGPWTPAAPGPATRVQIIRRDRVPEGAHLPGSGVLTADGSAFPAAPPRLRGETEAPKAGRFGTGTKGWENRAPGQAWRGLESPLLSVKRYR